MPVTITIWEINWYWKSYLLPLFMKWQISLISMMKMTKFDLTSRKTAVKNAKQYEINVA